MNVCFDKIMSRHAQQQTSRSLFNSRPCCPMSIMFWKVSGYNNIEQFLLLYTYVTDLSETTRSLL